MPQLLSSTDFLDRVRRSGLCGTTRLEHFLTADTTAASIADEMKKAGLLTDFQSQQLLGDDPDGCFIGGKYRILELLGRGGMGSVYLCEHVRMRRLVAVKVLPQEMERDQAMIARFEREAQAVASLDHPNIVRAFDIDQADGRNFLVMEFVDGTNLHTLVANHGPMSPARAAECIGQAALGLQHAWETGWVHRDIKPGNLLLDRSGCLKILDMGLARVFSETRSNLTSLFNEGLILGTADFLSPEQAAGVVDLDIRSDIYSLGATLYFLLTGKAPFEDGAVSQKLLWHRTLNPRPVTDIRPDVPPAMAALLDRMMAKSPANRPATPGEVALALAPFCVESPAAPDEREMPIWSPAVMDRIRANQTTNAENGPATKPLVIR
ncbi:MAG: serine/threonine protein kinase, partial [Planctomycetes bacterium]|nr:serine/threonine protein kinase [Planctomycetota bacterium]